MVAVSLFEAGSARGDLGCSGKLANSLAGRQSVFKFTRGSFENGMAFVRGDLRQRLECEAALMHGGMGHLETGVRMMETPNKRISISIGRGPLRCLGERRRPISRSILRIAESSCLGILSVLSATAQLTNQGWWVNSTGSVS